MIKWLRVTGIGFFFGISAFGTTSQVEVKETLDDLEKDYPIEKQGSFSKALFDFTSFVIAGEAPKGCFVYKNLPKVNNLPSPEECKKIVEYFSQDLNFLASFSEALLGKVQAKPFIDMTNY